MAGTAHSDEPSSGEPPFRPASAAWLAQKDAAARKPLGQYLTPRAVRQRLLDLVGSLPPRARVLDPGAGSGEFLLDVKERWPDAALFGFEVDPDLADLCRGAHGLAGVRTCDALAEPAAPEFDLVIGNPPYYELAQSAAPVLRYSGVISGRPNVFALFFQAGLERLKDGGRLAFVVPPSMNNGAYFTALRQSILALAAIDHLEILRGPKLFAGAQQSVMLIVLRKGARSERHVFRAELGARAPVPVFLEDPGRLSALLAGQATLGSLGFQIRTGRCVWNQHKEQLRREREPGAVHLVWAHNIGDSALEWTLDHPKRPQFVRHGAPDIGPAVVVNRITGTVGSGRLRAALVPDGLPFVGENHVNVVQRSAAAPLFASAPSASYRSVLDGLRGERAAAAVRLLTGNTQLSATELTWLVPVAEASARARSRG